VTRPSKENVRKHKRLNADYLLKYEAGGFGQNPQITNIKNISAGGMKFLTSEAIPETATLNVSVLIPPLEKSFMAHARVLRVRRLKKRLIYSVAVRFTDISKEDQSVLDDYVKSLAEIEGRASFLIDHANIVVRQDSTKE